MSKAPKKIKPSGDTDEMLPEYDFTKGVRGKHSQADQRGHAVNQVLRTLIHLVPKKRVRVTKK